MGHEMGVEDEKTNATPGLGSLPNRDNKWLSSISGGVASALVTTIVLVIPTINTWLANTREVQLMQIKTSEQEIAYITKRMKDSDKERDLYKMEMLECQKKLRELPRK